MAKSALSTITKQTPGTTTPVKNPSLALVNDRFTRARDYRTTSQDAIWRRSYNNWRGVLDKSLYPWRSKLFIPWSFTVVETIIPKVFARNPKWRAIPWEPEGLESNDNAALLNPQQQPVQLPNGLVQSTPDQATVVNNLLTYQWDRLGMRLKMYDFIKDSLMYSKGYAKVGWKMKMRNKTFMEPEVQKDGTVTFNKTERADVEYDDPTIDIIDPYDIYVDPDATSLDDAAYIIHRKTVPLEDVKNNPNYRNTSMIGQAQYADTYLDKLARYNNNVPTRDKHKDLVEILEYWGADDKLITVANRAVILRDTPNPYNHKNIPFIDLDDYRDPHRYYGQSELSVIDPLQRELNSIRNQRRDYDNLALNPVIRMVPGTLRNPNSAVMAPGNVWMVSDLQSMDVFELPQLQGSANEIEDRTVNDIKITTAIDEIAIGLLPENPQRRSATEVTTSQASAGKRFGIKVALLEEAVKKMGQMLFDLDQQFMDKQRTIQIVGERGAVEWVKLSPQDIRTNHFIDIEAGSMLPKDELSQRNDAIQLLQYMTPIIAPAAKFDPGVIMPFVRMILDTFDMPGKEEILTELKGALQMAQQAGQAQAQGNMQLQEAQTAKTQGQALHAVSQAHMSNTQAAQPPAPATATKSPQGGK